MAAVDDPVDLLLNEVGILTSDHHVQDSSRGGHNQNGRENAEERKDDQHLPSNCAPGFFYLLNELHWLSEAIQWTSAYAQPRPCGPVMALRRPCLIRSGQFL